MCLQRGTDWVFKLSGLRFVFKGLINGLVGDIIQFLGHPLWSHGDSELVRVDGYRNRKEHD